MPNPVKVLFLLGGSFVALIVLGLVTAFVTIAMTEKAGATTTGNVMMVALAVLAGAHLLDLAAVFVLTFRWVEPLWLRLLVCAGYGLLVVVTWLGFAFTLVVVLDR